MKKIATLILFLSLAVLQAQHRGDNFGFQGLAITNDFGAYGTARGSALTASKADINGMFYNPASLAGMKKPQISAGVNRYSKLWRENQNYIPNRLFGTISLYLEELYIPDPFNNDSWDGGIFVDPTLSYPLKNPQMGKDPYSEEAADWQDKKDGYAVSAFSAAVPLKFSGHEFVLGAAYSETPVQDVDRNSTYLAPHPGYTFYGNTAAANGKTTMNIDWYRFNRTRYGTSRSLYFGAGYRVNEYLNVGVSVDYFTASTDDKIGYNQYGAFLLYSTNQYKFRFITKLDTAFGTSDYSRLRTALGAITTFSKFTAGLRVTLPNELSRKWDYTNRITKNDTVTVKRSGTDKMKMGTAFAVGMSYTPKNLITLSFDLEYQPYGSAKQEMAAADSFAQGWVDQVIFRTGLELRPVKSLSLSLGYRTVPQVFVPDGNALKDRGPISTSYTFGVGYTTPIGRFDISYEFWQFRYYDVYYSNTNYNTQAGNNLSFGFTYTL